VWIPSHVGISGNEVANGLPRQAVESGTVHRQMTVANDHRILARQLIRRSRGALCTTISRVMSGHCSIRAHLERFRIVGDPICVCMMNYELPSHIISFGTVNIKKGTPIRDICAFQ
jgi:hypothetical protein